MADTDLPVRRLMKILSTLGCVVEFSKTNYLKAQRKLPSGQAVGWMQHCHKGISDVVRKYAVRAARRKLLLRECDGVVDDTFYSIS